ncbi:hypothetical protein ABPG74_010359 [Tetrahymena malaccensis]
MDQKIANLEFDCNIKDPQDLDRFFFDAYLKCEDYFIHDKINCYQTIPTQIPHPNCCFLVKKHSNSSKDILTSMHVSYPSGDTRKETANFKYREGNYPLNKLKVRIIEAKNADVFSKNKINITRIKNYYIVHTFYSEKSENVITFQTNQQQQPNNDFNKYNENFTFQNYSLNSKVSQPQTLPTLTQQYLMVKNIPLDQIVYKAKEDNNFNNCFLPNQDIQVQANQINYSQIPNQSQIMTLLDSLTQSQKDFQKKYENFEVYSQKQLKRISILEKQIIQNKSNIKKLKKSLEEKDKIIFSIKDTLKQNSIQQFSNLNTTIQSIVSTDDQNHETINLNQKRKPTQDITEEEQILRKQAMLESQFKTNNKQESQQHNSYDITEEEQSLRKQSLLENQLKPNIEQNGEINLLDEQTQIMYQSQTDQPDKNISSSQYKQKQIKQILNLPMKMMQQQELTFFISESNYYETDDIAIQQFADVNPTYQSVNQLQNIDEDKIKYLFGWVQSTDQSFNEIFSLLIDQMDQQNQLIQYKINSSNLLLFNKEAINENINLDINFISELSQQHVPILVFYFYQSQ